MTPALPPALRAASERLLDGASQGELAARAERISLAYRAGKSSAGVIVDRDDATAYSLARLPGTYAACARAFHEISQRTPDFKPERLLDAGTGPGGSAWAALFTWPEIRSACLLDSNSEFLAISTELAADAPPPLHGARRILADLKSGGPWPQSDLVIASYVLAEIPAPSQLATITALWEACDGILVFVEPGTTEGWRRLLAARDLLLSLGGNILAPCPHSLACPVSAEGDWCHFSQRLPRSRAHRMAKGGVLPFEDEKFSFLAFGRPGLKVLEPKSRILAHPTVTKPAIKLKLCTPLGDLKSEMVPKRDKLRIAQVRRLGWGEEFP